MATHIVTADKAQVLKAPGKAKLNPSLSCGTEVTAIGFESDGVWVNNDWNYENGSIDKVWIDLIYLSLISEPDPDPNPDPGVFPEFLYLEIDGVKEKYIKEE